MGSYIIELSVLIACNSEKKSRLKENSDCDQIDDHLFQLNIESGVLDEFTKGPVKPNLQYFE